MRSTRFNKFKSKNRGLIILLKVVLICYLAIFSTSYLTSDTKAYFTANNETEDVIKIGDWEEPDDSVLKFITKDNQNIKACDQSVDLKVKLKNTGTDMKSDSTYEIYYVENGNPEKQGTKLKLGKGKGTIQALQSGKTIELIHKTNKPGTYVFLANQSNDDLKEQITWSGWIKVHCPSDSKPKTKEDKEDSKATEETKEEVKETNKEETNSKEVKQESKEQQVPEKENKQNTEKEKSTGQSNKEEKTEIKSTTNGESKPDEKANEEQDGGEE